MCYTMKLKVLCVFYNGISTNPICSNYHRFYFHPHSYTHILKQFIQENIHLMHEYVTITVWYKVINMRTFTHRRQRHCKSQTVTVQYVT
jgi:hypothetical protein